MAEVKSSLNLRDVVEVLFERRKLFLGVVGVILLLTVAVTLLTPRTYRSEMKLLVQNLRGNVILSAEKSAATTAANDVTEQQINSELEVLNSQDVLEPVADSAWNMANAGEKSRSEVEKHEKAVMTFRKHLAADPIRKSNIISVSLTGSNPREAQNKLRQVAASYLAMHRNLQRPSGTSGFFTSEAERYRQQWNQATQDLVAFQQQHNITTIKDEQDSLQKNLTAVDASLLDAQVSLHELDGRVSAGAAELDKTPQRQSTQRKTVPNQQAIQQLSTLSVELKNKRTQLLTQFKPDDRLVKEVDQQIAQTESALQTATSGISEENTTDVDPTWQQVRTGYAQDKIKHTAALSQRNALLAQKQQMQQRLAELDALTVPFNTLQSRADNLKENYQLYVQKRDQAQVEDAMDESKLLNVVIAEQPTLSYIPVAPRPLMNFALGTITAIFLALLLLYFSEMTRSTVNTPRQLEAISSEPVIATFPESELLVGSTLFPDGDPHTDRRDESDSHRSVA